jgi:hypothetical protein
MARKNTAARGTSQDVTVRSSPVRLSKRESQGSLNAKSFWKTGGQDEQGVSALIGKTLEKKEKKVIELMFYLVERVDVRFK